MPVQFIQFHVIIQQQIKKIMENNLAHFKLKQVLNFSLTEKTLFLLGAIENQEGQAIAILSPKLHDPSHLQFQNICTVFTNDIYARFTTQIETQYDVQFIYPITEKHRIKYQKKTLLIHRETGQEYQETKQELLNKQLSHIQWVLNIIDGKTEVERVLFKCSQFLICQDFKWADVKDTDSLHITVIFSDPTLHSIRELRGEHLPLLEKVENALREVLEKQLGIGLNHCRMYFHYPPTFYRLHVHVMSLSLESLSCRVERCHDYSLVMQNLKMNGQYYKNATLNTFVEK